MACGITPVCPQAEIQAHEAAMTEDYLKNYRILGIQPGATWKQLRQAYKKLVNTWHPDRFQQDTRQKKLAEEKTKEITQSYKKLAEYYKKFGDLPLPQTEELSVATEVHSRPVSPAKDSSPDIEIREPVRENRSTDIPKFRMSKQRARFIAAMALLGSIYFIWQIVPWDPQDYRTSADVNDDPASNGRHEEASAEGKPAEKHFRIGSSLGEVYAIQGVPTKTEKDVWYYGNSMVYFAKGKVLRWDESTDNPLRVDIVPGSEKANTGFFGRGSTKEEVLAAQGKPDRDAGSVWDYGLSRVYFERDRVTGWHEAQFSPLRVRQ